MKRGVGVDVFLVPFPCPGHVTPMLHLGAALIPFGFTPVMITPDCIHQTLITTIKEEEEEECSVSYLGIPDGLEASAPRDFFTIETAMEGAMPAHLERILRLYKTEDIAFMVVDILASWAIQVAKRCGIKTVGFWPAMIDTYRIVRSIPDLLRTGIISREGLPASECGLGCVLKDDSSVLTTQDLPWLIGSPDSQQARFRFWSRVVDRCGSLTWILLNSFPDHHIPIRNNNAHTTLVPVGPLIPTSSSTHDRFWKKDRSCLDWLKQQKINSVIYISFGSWVGPIGEERVNKLACSLEDTGLPFLWVIGKSCRDGLPQGFTQRVSTRGRLVSWAPQIEILQHKAVGCYLTHCGWNSTLEAIKYQKKMLCYPIAGDQFVNSKYIVEVWRVGLRLGGMGKSEIREGVEKVIKDKDMGERLRQLHQTTMGHTEALKVEKNIRRFIHQINNKNNETEKTLQS